MTYVLPGQIQSDRLEAEFGIIRQGSGGSYLISVEQVLSSVGLRRLKLFSKLNLPASDIHLEKECCAVEFKDNVEDLDLLNECFQQSANLSEEEKASLYYICGYVTYKEGLPSADGEQDNISLPESEFLRNVYRGKLCYPSEELYDFSQYVYSFFKERKHKCCRKPFVQACKEIFEFTGYHFPNIDKISTRLVNCVLCF